MQHETNAHCTAIARAIRRYLSRHPAAADSELGIAQWWLAETGVEGSMDEVREALELLEREGVVEAICLDDGRRLWRGTQRAPRD